jgi:ATP-binding cassette subfamily F protein 3
VHPSDGGAPSSPQTTATAPSSGKKTKEQKRAEAEARNRTYRAGRGGKERLTAVETELAVAQERHEALIELMARPELYLDQSAFDAALAEYNEVKARIPVLEAEWVSLTDEIERAERES